MLERIAACFPLFGKYSSFFAEVRSAFSNVDGRMLEQLLKNLRSKKTTYVESRWRSSRSHLPVWPVFLLAILASSHSMRLVNHSSELIHQIYQREKIEDVVQWRDAVRFPPDLSR